MQRKEFLIIGVFYFMSGFPVSLDEGNEKEHIDFNLPDLQSDQSIEGLSLLPGTLEVNGSSLSGVLEIKGKNNKGKGVEVRLLPANFPYKKRESFFNAPLEIGKVNKEGNFRFAGISPGKYQVIGFFDANNNQLVEFGIDLVTGYHHSPVIKIGETGASRIITDN